jgi:hypothetical protein
VEALAQGFRRDGALVLLPVQHVFGPGPVQQVLFTCFFLSRCGPSFTAPVSVAGD